MKKSAHLFFIFLPLFVSLFLFSNIVSADEIELNSSSISNDINTFINEDFNFVKNYLLNSSDCSNNNYNHFTIVYFDNYYYAFCNSSNISYNIDSNRIYYYLPYSNAIFYKYLKSSNTMQTLNSRPSATLDFYNFNTNTMYFSSLIYDNSSQVSCSSSMCRNNIYYFYYLNNRIDLKYQQQFTSLYNLSLLSPSTPSDSTPLLTSFIDISIEKLQLICDFFTSSYVYLSIFVIFILYFVTLLLRRLK